MIHLKHLAQCLIHNKFSKLANNSSSCHCHCVVKTVKYRITDSWKPISVVDDLISTMTEESKIHSQYCLVNYEIKELTLNRS